MQPGLMHIMLADDDEDDRQFFKEAFEDIEVKHKISVFNNGVLLMEYLNNPENPIPDIVFLDLNMPMKSGKECLQEIRAISRLKNLTVAIYSTSSAEIDIEDTFVSGANVYICKPTDFNALKKALTNVISINWQYITDGLNKDSFILNV